MLTAWSRRCCPCAQEGYFDRGFSNYNSVAAFFAPVLQVNMLDNVVYERKNLLHAQLSNPKP